MKFEEMKELLFREAAERGLTDYDVYAITSTDRGADALGHELNSCTAGTSGGVSFRCAVDGKIGAAATESVEVAEIKALVARSIENAAVIDADEAPIFYGGSEKYEKTTATLPKMPEMSELRHAALDLQESIYAQNALVTDGTSAGVGAGEVSVSLANSKGLTLTHRMGMQYAYAEAVLRDGDEPSDGSAFSADIKDREIAKKAVEEALSKRGACSVPTGKYDIIFTGKQMRNMLSAFDGAFSGKNAMEGLSRLAGKVGEKIASDCVTIIDDPFYPENPMQMPFDAEGVATVQKALVENGLLKTLLYDLITAKKAGMTSTGNAARGSYADPVSIRPYCLRIAGGKETPEALRRRMKDGLYITELKGLHAGANGVTGDFSIESAGFLVKNGEIAAPVRGLTVAGNFFQLLLAVDGVADNVEMGLPSTCVMAAPDVLVRGLSVAGE